MYSPSEGEFAAEIEKKISYGGKESYMKKKTDSTGY